MTETHLPKTTEMLHTLSLEQLKELNQQISQMIQLKQPALRAGQTCEVDHDKLRGMVGEIIKVNRTKVKVRFDNSGQYKKDSTYNVPKEMIIIK